ncbi:hypothetical protein QBC45DRAFT_299599, partial [Copromyces sp. CBS 386.78]
MAFASHTAMSQITDRYLNHGERRATFQFGDVDRPMGWNSHAFEPHFARGE